VFDHGILLGQRGPEMGAKPTPAIRFNPIASESKQPFVVY
jgi:hypothetical protein